MDQNQLIVVLEAMKIYLDMLMLFATVYDWLIESERREYERRSLGQRTLTRYQTRSSEIHRITCESDIVCINELRMDRNAFATLCEMLKTRGGLLDDGNVTIEEQVSTFVNILAHHTKNRCLQVRFYRSGETISRYVHRVLKALLRVEKILFVKPTPVEEGCTDRRWKWFKGCLGAIDGTYVEVTVPESDKPRYRTRNCHIATNVLGACTRDMKFVYILSGWEGSATDSRVLRDAITRHNGLKVPLGNYYLADAGYINGDGRIDNGSFRLAVYDQMVLKMQEKISGIQVTTKNVQNKVKRMKDKYSSAYDMLNTSGFWWDEKTQTVVVEASVLADYLKKHPSKSYIANRPFPTYERLRTIFGKDRASGSMAEGGTDAWENMNAEPEGGDDNEDCMEVQPNVSKVAAGSSKSIGGDVSSKGKKKKRKAIESGVVADIIKEGAETFSAKMDRLINMVGSSAPPSLENITKELLEMGLDNPQCYALSIYFADNPAQLRLWNFMEPHLKSGFLQTLLRKIDI